MRVLIALTSILALGLLAAGARTAGGHGAVIRLAASAVSAGDSLGVTGEGLGSRDSVALVLEGAAGRFPLGSALGDDRGRFTIRVLVPLGVPAGEYRVVATGGHDRAFASLLVTADADVLVAAPEDPMHARADRVALERRRTPLETGVAGAVLVALMGAGVLLMRTRGGSRR
jgi:hypothetical protein